MKKRTASVILTATLLVSGCSASDSANPTTTLEPSQPGQTSSATPTASSPSSREEETSAPSESATPSSPDETSPFTESESPDDSSIATSSTSEAPSTVSTAKAGTILRLADFFEPDGSWEENRYEVADRKNVSGIGTEVSTSYEASANELELRLANDFETLEFTVGQANDSDSSARMMIVQVLGNNKQLDVQTVPFNTIQPIAFRSSGSTQL